MRGYKCPGSAARFCRGCDELRNYFRPATAVTSTFPLSTADCFPSTEP